MVEHPGRGAGKLVLGERLVPVIEAETIEEVVEKSEREKVPPREK